MGRFFRYYYSYNIKKLKLQAQNCDMMLVKCTHEWCSSLARMLLEMLADFLNRLKYNSVYHRDASVP